MQGVEQINAAHAIDGGMVNLCDHGEAARGNAGDVVETFDNREFPWRPAEVERARKDPRGLNAQLPPITGPGQGDMADVIFKIEFVVFNPIGIVEVERHPNQLLAHGLGQLDPAFEMAQDVFEPHKPARRGFRIVDQQRSDVHRRVARFHRNE